MKIAAAHWVGGAQDADAALAILEQYRTDWPAAWMRHLGRYEDAAAWLAFKAQSDAAEPDDAHVAEAVHA